MIKRKKNSCKCCQIKFVVLLFLKLFQSLKKMVCSWCTITVTGSKTSIGKSKRNFDYATLLKSTLRGI